MRRKIGIICIAFIMLLAAGGGYIAYDIYTFLHTPAKTPGKERTVDISPGMSFHQTATRLYKAGIISDVKRFTLLAKWKKQQTRVKAGEYRLHSGWLPEKILETITSGQSVLYKLFIPEGLPWWEVGRLVEQAGFGSFASFKAAVYDRRLLDSYDIPFANAEGFLYPDTYLLPRPRDNDAAFVVHKLIKTFWAKAGSKVWAQGMPDEKALRRTITLASLIEKETNVEQERKRIAGVFFNRLKRGMLLQSDPTIIYGLGVNFDGNIRRRHLEDPANPYNTYKHAGLPPGPVCSPGLRSIQAALAPEKHNLYYFVATGYGGHTFSRTLTEHNKAVRSYLAILRKNNRR